jgi:hypothetical protein
MAGGGSGGTEARRLQTHMLLHGRVRGVSLRFVTV